MTIYIAKRKKLSESGGSYLLSCQVWKSTCPVSFTEEILKVLPQLSKSFPLVRRIVRSGNAFTLVGCVYVYSEKRILEVY